MTMNGPVDLELPAELIVRLRARYAEPQRHYHSVRHIDALLRWLKRFSALAGSPASIEAAIWFHDAIYDAQRRDNETLSAELARHELGAIGWPAPAIERVAALVLATQHHEAGAGDADAWLFLDLDLSVLGQSRRSYAAYAAAVRCEYAWLPEADYRTGRAAVLGSFLERERIYRTPPLRTAWEPAARDNLRWELGRLSLPG